MATENAPKLKPIFCCNNCDYTTCKFVDYKRHLSTLKHFGNNVATFGNTSAYSIYHHKCANCNKEYADRSGLWKHKARNNCKTPMKPEKTTILDNEQLIIELLKQNKELLEIVKNGTTNNSYNTINTNNSHNNAFNLQFFLNETCKNAMNITDFIDSIKLQLPDLMDVGKLGFIEGISNIIVKNLNNLDETERPIHCTDKKRETFYVKDEGHWEKEDHQKKKIRKIIKNVAFKNEKLLQKYKEEHQGCNYSESKYADEYSKLVIEAMGGTGNNNVEKEEKIITNISKFTTIK